MLTPAGARELAEELETQSHQLDDSGLCVVCLISPCRVRAAKSGITPGATWPAPTRPTGT